MPISFACSCGKRLVVKDERAGKRMACPACERELTVPAGESRDTPPRGQPDRDESARPRRRKRDRARTERRLLWPWIVGAGAGVLALLAIPLAFWLGRGSAPADAGRPSKEVTPVATAPPEKTVAQAPPRSVPIVAPAGRDKSAPPTPAANTPATPRPQEKPPAGAEKKANGALAVRLLRFGPARIDEADFQGQTLTGAVIELEAAGAEGKARFEAPSLVATDREGKPVTASVLFIAGGREGLAPTATILAGTTGEAFDVSIGKSRFAPGPFPAALEGLRNIKTGDVPATARFNPPAGGAVINATDLMLLMPLHLARGGGVEYNLLPNRKVQLGVVFAADTDKLTGLKLLGETIALEQARRDDGPLPAPVARNAPRMPLRPGVPGPARVPREKAAHEDSGLWTVKAEGGEPGLVVEGSDCHAVALSRDGKQRAVFRSVPEDAAPARPGKPARGGGDEVACGRLDQPLRTIWTSDGSPSALSVTTSLHWSPGGQRLLLAMSDNLLVVDLKGKFRAFGRATALRQPGLVGLGMLEPASARWAGRSDTEVAVLARAPQNVLVLLNVATGQQRDLCPLPPSFASPTIHISDDQRTVAIFSSAAGGLAPQDSSGVWVWRRGQKAPVRLVTDSPGAGALSPDGKYLAVTLERVGKLRCVLYHVADRKEMWSADCPGFGYAFDPAGKRLAITTVPQNQLLVTPVGRFEPTELVKGGELPVGDPSWSADGKEIVFRRTSRP